VDTVRFGPASGGGAPGNQTYVEPSAGIDLAPWRAALRSQRQIQIRRLVAYRERGVFPTYLGPDRKTHISHRTLSRQEPVFVDDDGVRCAVGFLMDRSGWGDAVDEIAQTNNHVLVEEVRSGSLVEWVSRSGLTIEEASMIQPSYNWEPAPRRPKPRPRPEPDPMIVEHRRLTNHFIAVEEKLRNDTSDSIELALTRLMPQINAGLSIEAIGGAQI